MSRGKQDPLIGMGIALSAILFVLYGYPGLLSPTPTRFEGDCTTVPLSASAEDLRIDPATGLVYLTYYDRIEHGYENRATQGSVMLLDLNAREPRVRAALTAEIPNFAPSGLSLYTPPDGGPKRLFVVTLLRGRGAIEIFEQSPSGTFNHVESFRDRLLSSPVSIVAVGPRQFYVTNDDRRSGKRRGSGGLVYFDGEQTKQMAPRINDALGVAVSPDGRTLYLAEARRDRLFVYDRDLTTGEITYRQRVPLPSMPHNLTVDTDGNLWIASHPAGVSYGATLANADVTSPTQVLKYTPGAGRDSVKEIYVNPGKQLSAGSVAAVYGKKLIIGSIAEHKLLLCERKVPASPSDFSGPEKEDTPDT